MFCRGCSASATASVSGGNRPGGRVRQDWPVCDQHLGPVKAGHFDLDPNGGEGIVITNAGWRLVRGDTNQQYTIVNGTGEDALDVEFSAVGSLMISNSRGWSSTRGIVRHGESIDLDHPDAPILGWADPKSGIKISWRLGDARPELTLLIKDIDQWRRGVEFSSSPASHGLAGVVYKYALTGSDKDEAKELLKAWSVTLVGESVLVGGEGFGALGQGEDGLWRIVDTADPDLSTEGQPGAQTAIKAALDFVLGAVQRESDNG